MFETAKIIALIHNRTPTRALVGSRSCLYSEDESTESEFS